MIPIKITAEILVDELIAKFLWKGKGTRIVKNILKKKKSSLKDSLWPDFKVHHEATIIKIMF